VLGTHLWAHRGLAFAAFDPAGARVQGLPVRWLDLGSWASIAVMVSVATRALGVLPVFAMAVLPAMAALMVVRRLAAALAIAAVLGALTGGLGYLFAFFLSFPVGASQAMVAALLFVALVPVRLLLRR
jgi:ABC-type Mn2+/Zn2+ transport system permease subunit